MSFSLYEVPADTWVDGTYFRPGVIAVRPTVQPSRTWIPLNELAALAFRGIGVVKEVQPVPRGVQIQYPARGPVDDSNTMQAHALRAPKRPPV